MLTIVLYQYLPGAYILDPFPHWPLIDDAQLERVRSNLQHVVEHSPKGSDWIHGRKQHHIAKLYKHLQVIIVSSFVIIQITFLLSIKQKKHTQF